LSCTVCPRGSYSLAGFSSCFPKGSIGGIMKVDQVFQIANVGDFCRQIALLANFSVNDCEVIAVQPSTTYYFYLRDTLVDKAHPELSGNQQMIQLYNWFISDDSVLDLSNLPPIISFEIVTFDNLNGVPVTLFLGESTLAPVIPIVPTQPNIPIGQPFIIQNSSSINNYSIVTLLITFLLTILLW